MLDEVFTEDALRQAAEQLPGKPVTVNWHKVVGTVRTAEATPKGLAVSLGLDPELVDKYPGLQASLTGMVQSDFSFRQRRQP